MAHTLDLTGSSMSTPVLSDWSIPFTDTLCSSTIVSSAIPLIRLPRSLPSGKTSEKVENTVSRPLADELGRDGLSGPSEWFESCESCSKFEEELISLV